MHAEGWYRDPYGLHGDRWFSDGRPTSLVRDRGIESSDEPPPGDPPLPLVPVAEIEASDGRDLMRADQVEWESEYDVEREQSLPCACPHLTIGTIMENPPAHFPAWPDDAEVAVALTFDVDGEAPWLSEGPEYSRRLTMLSQGRFGPARGLGRILTLLAELDVPATFYVPGHTADQHPGAVEAIVAGGHEVGHHGYLHRGTDGLDAAAQRAELEDGLTALGKLGVRPVGYRSPGWELTPQTLDLLGELGFRYDASLMADDRPYWVTQRN